MVTGGAVAGDAPYLSLPTDSECLGCREWDQLIPIMEVEHQTDDAAEEGVCVTKHSDVLSLINPGVLETFFRMPRINWKQRATPDSPNGKCFG
jgi:hypothetical protein